jgi:hypothetical protein
MTAGGNGKEEETESRKSLQFPNLKALAKELMLFR